MTGKLRLMAAVVAVSAGLAGQSALAQSTVVKAGFLNCNVASGWGFVLGSTHNMNCTYVDNNGTTERYSGHVDKLGVDIGYVSGGVVLWAVVAPTSNLGKGALTGTYVGVTGGATAGVGGSANVLVGGSDKSVSLQPVSFEGSAGLNVAAGLAQIVLEPVAD